MCCRSRNSCRRLQFAARTACSKYVRNHMESLVFPLRGLRIRCCPRMSCSCVLLSTRMSQRRWTSWVVSRAPHLCRTWLFIDALMTHPLLEGLRDRACCFVSCTKAWPSWNSSMHMFSIDRMRH
jgi:hypothetical protein